ncbi:hypothetical protein UFOVP111_12 [uncultured Caudovirales phage]|uniref:Uncharacterized protein n=1 Tax=uncultured Caudovirales phage TaxID=2100421 RepID=A0A6J5L4J5_9CAUD|nr:hypothetical protein UFOVP111_12 [uncultured Caudovirales phage]
MAEEKSEHIIRQEHFIAGVETGIESERARILALLDQVPDMGSSDWADGYHESLEEAIKLIKGEKE